MEQPARARRLDWWPGWLAGAATAAIGAALLAAAWRADRAWFEDHVLLLYFVRPQALPAVVRAVAAVAGALLVGGGALLLRRRPALAGVAPSVVAIVAALIAGEAILRVVRPPRPAWFRGWELKIAEPHPRYGWASRRSTTTRLQLQGRSYRYTVDAAGGRVADLGARRDDARPALIVAGESIAVGYGLDYDQTFAAIAARELGLGLVNVAEGGYAPDQGYLRLVDVLPSVSHPAAVVTVFVASELGRLLCDDRPRLALAPDGSLEMLPPATGLWGGSRLRGLLHNRLPYISDAGLARARDTTSALLRATVRAAEDRHARPLFVVISLGPPRPLEQHPEGRLLRALFADPGLPYVLVDLDATDVFPDDGHPNPRGARRIADAIERALPRDR